MPYEYELEAFSHAGVSVTLEAATLPEAGARRWYARATVDGCCLEGWGPDAQVALYELAGQLPYTQRRRVFIAMGEEAEA